MEYVIIYDTKDEAKMNRHQKFFFRHIQAWEEEGSRITTFGKLVPRGVGGKSYPAGSLRRPPDRELSRLHEFPPINCWRDPQILSSIGPHHD